MEARTSGEYCISLLVHVSFYSNETCDCDDTKVVSTTIIYVVQQFQKHANRRRHPLAGQSRIGFQSSGGATMHSYLNWNKLDLR